MSLDQEVAMLDSLSLEYQASLIELEDAVCSTSQGSDATLDAGLIEATASPLASNNYADEQSTLPVVSASYHGADKFVNTLREEIESLRLSRSSVYSKDSWLVHDEVSKHGSRLSQLMSRDQDRISQRWSKLSNATSDISDSKTGATIWPLSRRIYRGRSKM